MIPSVFVRVRPCLSVAVFVRVFPWLVFVRVCPWPVFRWPPNTPSYRIGIGCPTALKSFKYACRALIRRPGFAALSIMALALGLGANAAIFRVVDGVLLQPLPYPDADR